ncbi:SusC/RagA family TonB-linked outer membrane protein [Mariniphaga sediminis]|uniref:SusC/RagA family TonB-linked outer membrane protein n=1 Tax=Mariniphaga sediminis TaxID=1628158 RepID=UPI003567E509
MKKALILIYMFLVASLSSFSQDRTISGTVTSAATGERLVAVTISVKGTSAGTITGEDGKYTLKAPSSGTLVASFVGMKTVEIPLTNSIVYDFLLESTSLGIDEVVVTALGIAREKKTLGYAVQSLSGEDLLEARDPNILNTLSGKVAGLQITSGGSTVGSSTRITIRGQASFAGNRPLIVVDGTPLDNRTQNISASGNVPDWGDSPADLDPNNIASITVLKGANASALYGSRATNGVILITTKSGKRTEMGIGVTYSNSTEIVQPNNFANVQNEYGGGSNGDEYTYKRWLTNNPGQNLTYNEYAKKFSYNWAPGLNAGVNKGATLNWGPRLNAGLLIDQFSTGPNSPFVAYPDNWKMDFYQIGSNIENNIAINATGEKAYGRISFTRLDQKGIHWNEDQSRNTFNASFTISPSDRVTASTNFTYTNRASDNIAVQGYNFGAGFHWGIVRNYDMAYERKLFDEAGQQNTETARGQVDNIFYRLRHENSLDRNRIYGNTNVVFQITDWLSATARIGLDHYDEYRKRITTSKTWSNVNQGRGGSFTEDQQRVQELNADFFLSFDKTFGNIRVDGTTGANLRNESFRSIGLSAGNLTVRDVYTIGNVAGTPGTSMFTSEREVQGIFAAANLSYKDYLFLGVTGRNDWSSTLPSNNRSYFYPSVSLGLTLNEALNIKSDILSHAQLRTSWAQVGSDTGPYQLDLTYSTLQYGGKAFFTPSGTLPPFDLKPEITTSYEIGTDLMFLENRFGLDLTFYKQITDNQILDVPLSRTTGFNSMRFNAGQIENRGVEVMARGTIIESGSNGFSWDVSVNWAKNKNMVNELYGNIDAYRISTGFGGAGTYGRPGKEWGLIEGLPYVRNDAGKIIVGANGLPLTTNKPIVLGKVNPDWIGGLRNEFTYKNLSVSFLIDAKIGGDIFSVTAWHSYPTAGFLNTVYAKYNKFEKFVYQNLREDGVLLDAVYADGTPNTTVKSAQEYFNGGWMWNNHEYSVLDASYVKLREMRIGYNLQVQEILPWVQNLNVSLTGRNLAILYRHEDTKLYGIDPETGFGGGEAGYGFENFQVPTTRTYGFRVTATF